MMRLSSLVLRIILRLLLHLLLIMTRMLLLLLLLLLLLVIIINVIIRRYPYHLLRLRLRGIEELLLHWKLLPCQLLRLLLQLGSIAIDVGLVMLLRRLLHHNDVDDVHVVVSPCCSVVRFLAGLAGPVSRPRTFASISKKIIFL
jgi:hypothetical protein